MVMNSRPANYHCYVSGTLDGDVVAINGFNRDTTGGRGVGWNERRVNDRYCRTGVYNRR